MFLGTGWVLALWLEKNQSSQLGALSLMVASVKMQRGFFFSSEKLEKRNGGQTLKKINKKETKNLKSESVYPAPLQFTAGVVCSLPCGRI